MQINRLLHARCMELTPIGCQRSRGGRRMEQIGIQRQRTGLEALDNALRARARVPRRPRR